MQPAEGISRRLASAARRWVARRPEPPEDELLSERDLIGISPDDRDIIERSIGYTMTGVPRLQALIDAVRYCVRREIPGAFAECGVWRGGSVVAMILTLQELGTEDRDIYLFDTFEGMTEPTERDVSAFNRSALEDWNEARERGDRLYPQFFDPEIFNASVVWETLVATGYPPERLHMVEGAVEETVPDGAPDRLGLLRLDTDWYESTWHELVHLYPRLTQGGVLIIDDYGHWEGARRAVEEYFAQHAPPPLLNRIDHTGRIAVKH
jgi:O-methyltransferase